MAQKGSMDLEEGSPVESRWGKSSAWLLTAVKVLLGSPNVGSLLA